MKNATQLHSQIDALYNQPLESEELINASHNLLELFEILIAEDIRQKKQADSGNFNKVSN